MIPNTTFSNSTPVCGLDEHRVCADLDPITSPGIACAGCSGRLSALVLVGNERATANAEDIHRASNPEFTVFELKPFDGVALILRDLDMKAPARVHGRIGEPQPFHLLQVEQPFAIRERVQ